MNKFVPADMLTELHLHKFFQLTDFYERDRVRKHCRGRYVKNYHNIESFAIILFKIPFKYQGVCVNCSK